MASFCHYLARFHVYARILDEKDRSFTETRGMKDRDLAPSAFPPPVALAELGDCDVVRRESSGRAFVLYAVRLAAAPESTASITVQMAVDATDHYALLATYRGTFSHAMTVDDAQVERYYRAELAPALTARGQKVPPLAEVREQIRELLVQRDITERAGRWLEETRPRLRIEIQPGDLNR